MPGKHYKKLGRTKLVRLPEKIEPWIKVVARKLDDKNDPQEIMNYLIQVIDRNR